MGVRKGKNFEAGKNFSDDLDISVFFANHYGIIKANRNMFFDFFTNLIKE